MENFPNKKDRFLVLGLWMIFFVTAVSFGLFLLAFQDIGTILTFLISSIGTIFLSTLIKKVSKGYFLKYYFNKKELYKLIEESLKSFEGADEEFIKEFKRRASFQYYTTGSLFYTPTLEDDKWLLSNKDNLAGFIMLIGMLIKCIEDKKGFNEFIDDSFNLTHSGELVMKTLENGFLSGELRYLLFIVYLLTDFNLEDNNLSDEYTEKINKIRKELDDRYSHLLFNFKDEVQDILNRLTITNKTILN